ARAGDGGVDQRRFRVVVLAVLPVRERGSPVAGTEIPGGLTAGVGSVAARVGRVGRVVAAGVSRGRRVVGRCAAAVAVVVAATGGDDQSDCAGERSGPAESGHPVLPIELVRGVFIVSSP